jgi:hypothetical protein
LASLDFDVVPFSAFVPLEEIETRLSVQFSGSNAL